MNRELSCAAARSSLLFESFVASVLVLAMPLLIATAVEAPPPAGVAVLALVLSALIAIGSRSALLPNGTATMRLARSPDARVQRSAGVTNPSRHPHRPRAPGPA